MFITLSQTNSNICKFLSKNLWSSQHGAEVGEMICYSLTFLHSAALDMHNVKGSFSFFREWKQYLRCIIFMGCERRVLRGYRPVGLQRNSDSRHHGDWILSKFPVFCGLSRLINNHLIMVTPWPNFSYFRYPQMFCTFTRHKGHLQHPYIHHPYPALLVIFKWHFSHISL